MLKTGIRALRTASRTIQRSAQSLARSVGVEEQYEEFQQRVDELPLVRPAKKLAQNVGHTIAPEQKALYGQEAGPFKVSTFRKDFVDEPRGRKIPMTVYYPTKSSEKTPVVVISPGLGGNAATYRYLGRHLASHGYTVLQPTHKGSDTCAVVSSPLTSFTQKELVDRSKDVRFALDLLEDAELPRVISDQADIERAALAGHSFGGLTAQVMAGVVSRDEDGKALPLTDERLDAFVSMSPFGDTLPTQILNMDPQTYEHIEQPILFLAGDKDRIFNLGNTSAHKAPYQGASSVDKYHLEIGDAHHLDFGQIFGWFDRNTADMTKSTTLAFLDAHLKSDEGALEYLIHELPDAARSRNSVADTPT